MGCAASKAGSETTTTLHQSQCVPEANPCIDQHAYRVPTDNDAGSNPPDAVSVISQLNDQAGHQHDAVIQDKPDELKPPAGADALRSNFLEVRSVLQRLTAVNSNPLLGLAEAAELLRAHLGVSLVSIIACMEATASYVLMAACGTGSAELESCSYMQGADWSPFMLDSNTNHIYISVDDEEQQKTLPKDWELLYEQHSLSSFISVPVAATGRVLGLLTIAKTELHAFNDEWWEPMLSVLAVGLVPQLRSEHITGLSHLVSVLHGTQDHLALIAQLLQGAQQFLLKATNISMAARLGLVDQDLSSAYIFEIDSKPSLDAAKVPDRQLMPDVTITSINLENTLLSAAIRKGKARFVSDCANYLQSCVKPATDIFISSHQMAASIVVLPLQYGGQTLGGLYFVLEHPSNFQNTKDMMMGFVNNLVLVMVQKLEGQLHRFWDLVVQRQLSMGPSSRRSSWDAWSQQQHGTTQPLDSLPQQQQPSAAAGAGGGEAAQRPDAAPDQHHKAGSSTSGDAAGAAELAAVPQGAAGLQDTGPDVGGQQQVAAAAAGRGTAGGGAAAGLGLSDVDGGSAVADKRSVMQRTCTQAMLMVLQNEIRKTHERKQQLVWIDDLVLLTTIGKGAFGVVYQGSWKGSLAAIKVMYARQHERQAMKDALEMAVLSSVSHPNIIQVYNCFTNMMEEAGTQAQQPTGRYNTRFRRLEAGEDTSKATCNIMVMEYCDRGSLWNAMKQGVFHKRLSKARIAVDLCAIVQVLMEVAASVHYLHNMQLLHCDIKADNVLLKSDSSSPTGFITKLSDFGLAKLLRDKYYIINRSGSGTITHLAPELFKSGSKVTAAVDAFSFGIMMWELYMGQRAYSGLGRDALIDKVYKQQSRPVFPPGVPTLYSELACNCWETDQHLRPNFTTIRQKLQDMMLDFRRGLRSAAGPAYDAVKEGLDAADLATQQQQQLDMQLAAQQQAVQQQQRWHSIASELVSCEETGDMVSPHDTFYTSGN